VSTLARTLDSSTREVRLAARALRRVPTVTLLAILTLALGIGAAAAIFSVTNAVLLQPLGYPDADRLVRVYESRVDEPGWRGSVSVPNLDDWRAQSRTLAGLVAFQMGGRNLQTGTEARRVAAVEVSANAFTVLGNRPLLGRGFVAGEDAPSRDGVVVLGEGLWRRAFGGDPAIVGRTVTLDGRPHEVVGVMPRQFVFPAGAAAPDLWVPYTPSPGAAAARGSHMLAVVARLAPGATHEQAAAEMRRIAARIAAAYPDEQTNRTVALVPYHEDVSGQLRPVLLLLMGAVILVLAIACANVANLLLARATERRRDVAVRIALGAGRRQIVRQHLAESLLLGMGGAVLGGLLAWGGVRALTALAERAGVRLVPVAGGHVPLDLPVLGFLVGVSVLSALLFGLAPALQASSTGLPATVGEAGGVGDRTTAGHGPRRARGALVVTQLALSLVLLVGVGLLGRAFVALRATPSGLDTSGVVTARLSVPGDRAALPLPELVPQLHHPVLERVRALPGVQAAGLTSMIPIERWGTNGGYWVVGHPEPAPGSEPLVELRQVSPGYFAALRIPVRHGRDFAEADGETGAEPVLVNEAFVRREFGEGAGARAIGQRIRRDRADTTGDWTIVGVVGDVRQGGLERPPMPEMYFPYRSARADFGATTLVVRVRGGEAAVTPRLVDGIRGAVAGVAPDVPLYAVRTMREVVGRSLGARQVTLTLFGLFSVLAAVLAAAGLYGVMAYGVARRSRELAIRMALGADRAAVVRLVLGDAARLTTGGVVVGTLAALGASRLLATMLYGVGARDPLTFVGAAALLALVALAAAYVPSRRAARADPQQTLRAA
jgi:predicted permease